MFFLANVVVLLCVVGTSLGAGCGSNGEPTVCTTPSTSQDRRSDKSQLTVATLNAEWLFWSNGKGGPSTKCPLDHSQGTCPWVDTEQAQAHIRAVALALNEINADIITLVEAQDCVVLQCLINNMGDSSYKPYLIKGTDTATDQNVGIITRIDPSTALFRDESRATIYSADSTCGTLPFPSYNSGVSKHFIARFSIPQIGEISLIGVHFLAFPTDPDRCIKREAQATVINKIAEDEKAEGRDVIILGDVNDYDADILDASNSYPTSRVSRILKYSSSTKKMYNVVERVRPPSKVYSNWWDKNSNCRVEAGELTLIDHIFVSPNLNSLISSVDIFNIVEICGSLQSDHFPIKVTFQASSQSQSVATFRSEQQGLLPDTNNDQPQQAPNTLVGIYAVVGLFGISTVVLLAYVVYLVTQRRKQEETDPLLKE